MRTKLVALAILTGTACPFAPTPSSSRRRPCNLSKRPGDPARSRSFRDGGQRRPRRPATQQLNAWQDASSFRGFELVYANAEAGGTFVTLGNKVGGAGSGEGGAAFGVGAGLRFVTWTLGLRARIAPLADFTLFQANLEAGFHLPVGAFRPLTSSTVAVTALKNAPSGAPMPSGFDLGGSLGPIITSPRLAGPRSHGRRVS